MNDVVSAPMSKAEQVVQLLLKQIVDSDLKPGTSMGTEASLLEQFQVSRPTLRESLRVLASQGVLRLRPGPRGGIVLSKPSIGFLVHSLSVYLRLNDVPFIAVLRAREVIEPALARGAASNGTEEHFRQLGESIARMETIKNDERAFIEENRVFHSILANAAANPVLEVFWQAISLLAQGEGQGIRYSARNQSFVVAAHKRILQVCEARDEDGAAREMSEHVMDLERLLRARHRELSEKPTRITPHPSRNIS